MPGGKGRKAIMVMGRFVSSEQFNSASRTSKSKQHFFSKNSGLLTSVGRFRHGRVSILSLFYG